MTQTPLGPPVQMVEPFDARAVHALVQRCFEPLRGRIDPPSSAERLDEMTIRAHAAAGELWAMLDTGRPVGCIFLSRMPDSLYIAKLAVDGAFRGRGLARMLIDRAVDRAEMLGLPRLIAQSRVELTEVHAMFEALGFRRIGTTSHPGYERPTSITFARELASRRAPRPLDGPGAVSKGPSKGAPKGVPRGAG
ncbi:MAG: GNAT family N-acetyltransferase [Pseudomonadota bacterium]